LEISSETKGGKNDMPGYETQQVGDATEISTTPEKVPYPWLLIAIPGGLLVLIALAQSFIWGVIAAGFCYGAMYADALETSHALPHAGEISRFQDRR
jgi:hypothetical protein